MPVHTGTQQLLTAAVLALLPYGVHAGEYQSLQPVPEEILRTNIEALAAYVLKGSGKAADADVHVTRIIGREALVHGKQRVWFCLETRRDGRTTQGCGADVQLIQLDSGRWIIQDLGQDAWLVVQDAPPA